MKNLLRTFLPLALLIAGAFASPNTRAEEPSVDQAVASAKAWLALMDDGKYGESWEASSTFFKEKIGKPIWEKTTAGVRDPLGRTNDRKLVSAAYTSELPGAPKGDYVVIQFATDFSGKRGSVETITPMKDADGVWRVSGYFIK